MIAFRAATPGEAEAIASLHAESWRLHYRGAFRDEFLDGDVFSDRRAVWQKRLSQPAANQLVLVASEGGRLLGFACAYGCEDEQWGTLLDNLHVHTALHRRGLGARLVSEVGRWCRANYADRGLYLWVLEQNLRAQRFYQRMGARDRGGALFEPEGGGQVSSRRYAWTTLDEIGLSG